MRARLAGLGIWLPELIRRNSDWPAGFAAVGAKRGDRTLVDFPDVGSDLAAEVTARHLAGDAHDPFLGANERRVASPDVSAWQAETYAASRALEDAGVHPREIDVIMSWSIVPDRVAHATAPRVAHELGAKRAFALSADAGCASPLVQLSMASALLEAGRAQHVLLTQSHLITRAFPMAHPASPGVGDCATAMVVSASEVSGLLGVHSVTHGEYWDAISWVRGRDDESDTPWWTEGSAFLPGSRNPAGAKALMRETVKWGASTSAEALERFRVDPSEVTTFASVQPRRWIPEAIAEVVGLDAGCAPQTYDSIAHVGGCGVVANLIEARRRGMLESGTVALMYAQGAGFTRSAAILRVP